MRFPFTGVIPVDKPRGVSSRRVVDVVARALSMKAVGHSGTLDPLATGVVVVCVGHATKLVDYLHGLTKHYSAVFQLGRGSPSDDLETPVEPEENPVRPSPDEVEAAAAGFRGDILQRPCDYSAVHVDGRRAYRLARAGRPAGAALEPKPVRIERLAITAYCWPRLEMEINCSSGTFIRAIGRDLAESLGTRAVMESLVRTAVGPFALERALPLDRIAAAAVGGAAAAGGAAEGIAGAIGLLPAVAAVGHLPRIVLDEGMLELAARGGLLAVDSGEESLAAVDRNGMLVGILRRHASGGHRLRPNFLGR